MLFLLPWARSLFRNAFLSCMCLASRRLFCMRQDLHFGFYGDLDKSQPSRRRLEKNRCLYIYNIYIYMCIYISLYDGTCHAASTGKCGWGAKKTKVSLMGRCLRFVCGHGRKLACCKLHCLSPYTYFWADAHRRLNWKIPYKWKFLAGKIIYKLAILQSYFK